MKIENKISLLLNETENEDYVKNFLMKNCKPFINDLKKTGPIGLLYSGRKSSEIYFKKSVRKDRKPTDTSLFIHNILDDEFKKHFGYKYRSGSLFTTGSSKIAEDYGNVYAIFPIGKYEIVWSHKFDDLFYILDIWNAKGRFPSSDESKEKMLNMLDIRKNYKKGDLENAILSKNEVMLKCENYFAVLIGYYGFSSTAIIRLIKDL